MKPSRRLTSCLAATAATFSLVLANPFGDDAAGVSASDLSTHTSYVELVPPAPSPNLATDRIAHGPGRLFEATTTFGRAVDPNVAPVPKDRINANLDRRRPTAAVKMTRNTCQRARELGAENVVMTVPLAWGTASSWRAPEESLQALIDVGNGEYNHIYAGIAKEMLACGYPSAILRLGHEHNMPWTPWYSGGGRADHYTKAFRTAAQQVRNLAPGIAFDWTIGASGAAYDGSGGGAFDPASWPGNEWVDIVGRDIYCRNKGRGLKHIATELVEHAEFAASKGKPVSYPEIGVSLPLPGDTDVPDNVGSDAACAPVVELILAYANQADLAYFNWWNSQKTSQGYRYAISSKDRKIIDVMDSFFGPDRTMPRPIVPQSFAPGADDESVEPNTVNVNSDVDGPALPPPPVTEPEPPITEPEPPITEPEPPVTEPEPPITEPEPPVTTIAPDETTDGDEPSTQVEAALALVVGNDTPDSDANEVIAHLQGQGWQTVFVDDDAVGADLIRQAGVVVVTPAAGLDGSDIPTSPDTPVLVSGADAMEAQHLATRGRHRRAANQKIDGVPTRVMSKRAPVAVAQTVDGAEILALWGRSPSTFGIPAGSLLADQTVAETSYAGFFAGPDSFALLNDAGWELFDSTLSWLMSAPTSG